MQGPEKVTPDRGKSEDRTRDQRGRCADAPVGRKKPRNAPSHEVGLERGGRVVRESSTDDLFDLTVVQVDARPEDALRHGR